MKILPKWDKADLSYGFTTNYKALIHLLIRRIYPHFRGFRLVSAYAVKGISSSVSMIARIGIDCPLNYWESVEERIEKAQKRKENFYFSAKSLTVATVQTRLRRRQRQQRLDKVMRKLWEIQTLFITLFLGFWR